MVTVTVAGVTVEAASRLRAADACQHGRRLSGVTG
jgi:hypothetical protein